MGRLEEGSAVTSEPLEMFARAWVAQWIELGGTLTREQSGQCGAGMIEPHIWQRLLRENPALKPHLVIRDPSEHAGAVKSLRRLAEEIPGASEAIFRQVPIGGMLG